MYNRLAVYSHRGWLSSAIVKALATSGAPLRVLHRPGSDVSSLPPSVVKVEVDLADEAALTKALEDIDILISLVGQPDVALQHHMMAAIKQSKVKLFVPSDLGFIYPEEARAIPVLRAKMEVEDAARAAGIPVCLIKPNSTAESGLSVPLKGIEVPHNRFILTEGVENNPTSFCTRAYVATAYADIFAATPIAQLTNRTIGLSELTPTGNEIIAAMTAKYGKMPEIARRPLASTDDAIASGHPFALAAYCRKLWATGQITSMLGELYEVKGYQKKTLQQLVVDGELEPYKELPSFVTEALRIM